MGGNYHLAEELTQETFYQAAVSLDGSRVKVTFHSMPDTEETALKLRSVGEKLQRVKFKISAAGN